jgi:N-methylhydantoinase A
LLAFGGAGPMHACELALDLGIRHVVLPRNPGLLCAWGALGAPLGREYSITIRETAPKLTQLSERARPLIARARTELMAQGASAEAIRNELSADLRYRGQEYEIEVKLGQNFTDDFHAAHRRTFGHAAPDAPVEAVNLRLRAVANGPPVAAARIARAKSKPAPIGKLRASVGGAIRDVAIYARESFGAGARLSGPAIIAELSATAYVAPEFTLRTDDFGNLHLQAG